MPAVIPFIANYAATYFLGNTLAAALITFGAAAAVGNHQRRKAQRQARDAFNASLTDRTNMLSLTQGARSRVYGRVRNVDGVIFKGTWGADKRYYTLVVALAGHEVDAIEDVYFNDTLVALDGSGYVTTAPWAQTVRQSATEYMTVTSGSGSLTLAHTPVAGSVAVTLTTGGPDDLLAYENLVPTVAGSLVTVSGGTISSGQASVAYQWDQAVPYARVRKFLGAAGQDLSSYLTPNFPDVTSADKFQGIALLLVDLEYSQDAFPTGVPSITAVMRGAKILDTRTSTTAWTQNNAMIARDWSLYAYGGGMSSGQFNATAAETAANACDVDTTFTTGAGSVTMDTYQCGIVIPLDGNPLEALDEIVESMAGRWGWSGGVLKLVAGSYRSSVATVTEDWITDAADIDIVNGPARNDLVNAYRPTIANRDNHYIAEPMPVLAPSAYTTSDGQQLMREIQMAGVTSREHALHIAGVLLRDARQGLAVKLPCNMRAWQLELFDTVAVTLPTFGWSAKVFEVLGWEYTLTGGVMLALKETAASIYTADAAFTGLENSDNTELPVPTDVEAITGLAVNSDVSTNNDGQPVVRTRVTWDAATDINVLQSGFVEISYLQLGAVDQSIIWLNSTPVQIDWSNASGGVITWQTQQIADAGDSAAWQSIRVRGDQTSLTIAALRAGGFYLFRVRAENTNRARSRWSTHVLHEVGTVTTGGETFDPTLLPFSLENTPGTSTTVTAAMHIPDGYTWNTVLAEIPEFTAEHDGDATVTFAGSASYTNAGAIQHSIQDRNAAYNGWTLVNATTPTGTNSVQLANTRTFPLTQGVAYKFQAMAAKASGADTMTVSSHQLSALITYTATA